MRMILAIAAVLPLGALGVTNAAQAQQLVTVKSLLA